MNSLNLLRALGSIFRLPLLVISSIYPRKNNLWIFGNSRGFLDNSRYLFEYVHSLNSEIKVIWMSSNSKEVEFISDYGYCACNKYSIKGIYYSLIAKCAFVTQGMSDINRFLIGGQYLVFLGHGDPIKNILLDSKSDWQITTKNQFQFINQISHYLFKNNLNKYNLIITNSKLSRNNLSSAFGRNDSSFAITGLPRNDFILSQHKIIKNKHKTILLAPTWRNLNTRFYKNILHDIKWSKLLRTSNYILYIKDHPVSNKSYHKSYDDKINSQLAIPDSDYIKFIPKNFDINTELHNVDILITDYSSILIDFSLLERPILFFTPDYDNYLLERGFYFDYKKITNDKEAYNIDQLYNILADCIQTTNKFIYDSKKIKKLFHDFPDSNACSRILNRIMNEINY